MMMAITLNANSQTTLVTNIETAGGGSPPPTAYQVNEISLNLDGLKQVPESLVIDFPDNTSTTVPISNFIPRNGFTVRTDNDPPGTPPVYPTPGVSNDELDYLWTGSNTDYDVMLSVSKGQLTGLITGNVKRYGIQRTQTETYNMIDVRLEGYPAQDIVEEIPSNTLNPKRTTVEPLNVGEVVSRLMFNEEYTGTTTPYTPIDILVLYTNQARIDAGGDPNDVNDREAIESLVEASVDHSNVALMNSQTNTRVYNLSTAPLFSGFNLTGDVLGDRERFAENPVVQHLRNVVGADIVTLMVGNPSSNFSYCGVAFVQTHETCGHSDINTYCTTGENFEDFSFNIVSQECSVLDDTFTHEFGHLMGGNHVDIPSQLTQSWVNNVINNGYPDAFAELVNGTFASIMSINFDTPRRLYFSNPNVTVNGVPTGENGTKHNAKIIDELSPTMSEYRIRMDYIFANGFEQQ